MENISIDDNDDAHERMLTAKSLAEILQEDLLPFRSTQVQGFKVLPAKQVLHTLPILLEQLQDAKTFKNLLSKIRQIFYLFYWAKKKFRESTQ